MSSGQTVLEIDDLRQEPSRRDALTWQMIDIGERLAAGLLLILLSPMLLAAALAVMVLSRRSPLVAHRRLGLAGRSLWVLKLRTMWGEDNARSWSLSERLPSGICNEPIIKQKADPRVKGRFAACCRRFSIDELPQLWHVVCGEMALVGPRPMTAEEIRFHYGSSAEELLSRKPGLTGLWQVTGRSSLTYKQRRRLDIFMLRRWKLTLYLKILSETIPAVFSGRNAW